MKEISGVVLGSMFVQIVGDKAQIEEAIQFLRLRGVAVSQGAL